MPVNIANATDYPDFTGEPLNAPAPEVNVPLVKETMTWINAQEALGRENGSWNQGVWISPKEFTGTTQPVEVCGTQQCFAGHAMVLHYGDRLQIQDAEGNGDWNPYVDGMELDWETTARKILGLTEEEATTLFIFSSSIESVRRNVAKILERVGEPM